MAKIKGTTIYLSVWTGVWTKVGAQKDVTIDRGRATIETTNKDSDDWDEFLPSFKNWSISFDAFLIESPDDSGFVQMENDYDDDVIQNFRITTNTHTYTGLALVEGLSMTAALKDAGMAAFTLKGTAALVKV